jgi:hypothetical protein
VAVFTVAGASWWWPLACARLGSPDAGSMALLSET